MQTDLALIPGKRILTVEPRAFSRNLVCFMVYCVLNNNTFKLFLIEHIIIYDNVLCLSSQYRNVCGVITHDIYMSLT